MTTAESWKFTWLTLRALFVYTDGPKAKVNWVPIAWALLAIAALTLMGVFWTPLGFVALAALVVFEPVGLWFRDWSGYRSTRYLNEDRDVALIVRTRPDGWRPDTHVKIPGTPTSTVHEFRVQTSILLLTAANDQHISLSLTPRDDLRGTYEEALVEAQKRMGLPAGRIRTLVQGRKRFPRGHDYSCPPAGNTVPA